MTISMNGVNNTWLNTQKGKLLGLVNQERLSIGTYGILHFYLLFLSEDLCTVAQAHAEDMVQRDFYDHTNPDGLGPYKRVVKLIGNSQYVSVGENIAMNLSVEEVHTSWMKSPGHKRNILDPDFNTIGIGIAHQTQGAYKGLWYYVELFGETRTHREHKRAVHNWKEWTPAVSEELELKFTVFDKGLYKPED